ncbi:hypothetical protein H6G81_27325 [Scytonema hofmannii FACHB-248]|uniref:Uncharacterized protein n=1 Tax=Scytonema hofmannii FACHB-248 TaxID=1842502 RepID=A0ABR8GYB7_9CYAN|nr:MULTISPECIES: hypothetical protein [Nostocales]MBD2608125.1 hypothetical protein [Scytonema hofmannii FACHB-248]
MQNKEAAVSDARSILIGFFLCQCPMPNARCPILFYNLLGFYVMVAFFNIALVKIYEKQHPECGRCSSG